VKNQIIPKKDGSGPPKGATGPKDGRGQGQGQTGKGSGPKTGGGKGTCK